jgi:hypothetical protein
MSKGWQWFLLILVGGLGGVFLGELLVSVLPPGVVKDLIAKAAAFGLDPPGTLDLKFLTLTIGFRLKMTVMGLLGLVLAIILGRHL